MKHSQEMSESDLQAAKIGLGHFLGMFHAQNLAVEIFTMGVNGCL